MDNRQKWKKMGSNNNLLIINKGASVFRCLIGNCVGSQSLFRIEAIWGVLFYTRRFSVFLLLKKIQKYVVGTE